MAAVVSVCLGGRELVDEAGATRWIAEGYDAAGDRVSGIHGDGEAP
jgi:hypothetical protein